MMAWLSPSSESPVTCHPKHTFRPETFVATRVYTVKTHHNYAEVPSDVEDNRPEENPLKTEMPDCQVNSTRRQCEKEQVLFI